MQKKLLLNSILLFSLSFSYQSRNPLKVLFWLNSFPSKTGGSSLNQIIGFITAGHDVTILTQHNNYLPSDNIPPELAQYDILSKVFVKRLPKERTHFDIILCQSTSHALPLLEFRKNNTIKGKMIVFVRGADLNVFRDSKNARKIFESFDLIAPVCEYFKNKLINMYQYNEKIKVLHSSIDCKKFKYRGLLLPGKKELIIITTSRLSSKKGLDIAIKSIALLVKKYPYLTYYIIGDGRSRKELEQIISHLNLEKNVYILGWKTALEVVALLQQGHIFILPSITHNNQKEGIPNAVKEAMAVGIPVVSTLHAGIPELIEDGITGFLVPEKDVSALANKIDYLINHPEIWEKIITAARSFIENNFERETENKKLIEMCYKLVE